MNSASKLRLCNIAGPALLTVAADTPFVEVLRQFAARQVSSLIVIEAGQPVGIVTERDLVRLMGAGPADERPVRAIMSKPLLITRDDLDFPAAQLMMSNRAIRHLVLVDAAGVLLGVASESDFCRHLGCDVFAAIQSLGTVIDRGVELLAPGQPLAAALQIMSTRRIDYVLIGQVGRAAGIFTEGDVPRLFAQALDPAAVTVGEVMTDPLHTIGGEVEVADAARQMALHGLRHLAVVDAGGEMMGVISQHRMLERLGAVLMEENRSQLESRLSVVLEATGVGTWEYDHQRELLIRSQGLNKVMSFSSDMVHEKLDDILQRVHPEDYGRVAAVFRELRQGAVEQFSIDYRIQGGDGQMRWMTSRGRLVECDGAGKPLRSAGVAINIEPQKTSEMQLRLSEARFRGLIENVPLPLCQVNARGELIFINQHFTEEFGYTLEDVPNLAAWWRRAYPDESYRAWVLETWNEAVRIAAKSHSVIHPVEYSVTCRNGSVRVVEISGITFGDDFLATFIDVTERRHQQALLLFSNAILRHISIGAPLAEVLDFIAREIEEQEPDMRCSVLLLDESGQQLRHGAAPSLPRDYCATIDGEMIGPRACACGKAAYLGEAVFVADIATDPLWDGYRETAQQHGLAACWSSPIISSTGAVLGTFAVYWAAPRSAVGPVARGYVESATALAAIAIEGVQREAELHRMINELRRWQQLTLGREGRVLELKREVNALLGRLGDAPRYGSVVDGGEMA